MKTYRFIKKTYRARILIEGARFPPFGFDIAEMSSNSNEDISVLQKDLSCPDSDRERLVSPLRVRYSGDKPRSFEVPRRESRSEINFVFLPYKPDMLESVLMYRVPVMKKWTRTMPIQPGGLGTKQSAHGHRRFSTHESPVK